MKKKKVCLIPARYDASRYDGKLLKILIDKRNNKEKTVIRETYERMSSYNVFDDVIVVTNSRDIKNEIEKHKGKVAFIEKNHTSGTDRIAEAAVQLDAEIIFNVQGDEPFIAKKPLEELAKLMEAQTEGLVVSSLMKELKKNENITSSDYVKVVCNKQMDALYFSRSVIPHPKKEVHLAKYYEHVGVYAFTRQALLEFSKLAPTPLELVESVECLRYLENGIPVKMVETDTFLLEIDTEEDLNNVNKLLAEGTISLV